MKYYEIISSSLRSVLEIDVNAAIQQGYTPTGGLIIDKSDKFNTKYLQAVYKISKDDN